MNGELEKRSPFWIGLSVGQRDRPLKAVVSKPKLVSLWVFYKNIALLASSQENTIQWEVVDQMSVELNSMGASTDPGGWDPSTALTVGKIWYQVEVHIIILSDSVYIWLSLPNLSFQGQGQPKL